MWWQGEVHHSVSIWTLSGRTETLLQSASTSVWSQGRWDTEERTEKGRGQVCAFIALQKFIFRSSLSHNCWLCSLITFVTFHVIYSVVCKYLESFVLEWNNDVEVKLLTFSFEGYSSTFNSVETVALFIVWVRVKRVMIPSFS